jgi:hypothetical protein
MGEAEQAEWFYAVEGQQGGPVSVEQLRKMVGEGAVGARDLVWRDGMEQWVAAKKVPELWAAEETATAATPPPPVTPPPPPPPSVLQSRVAPAQHLSVQAQRVAVQYRAAPVQSGQIAGRAIAAFILGLASVFFIPGPFAVVFAILAFRDMRREGKGGMIFAVIGLVLGVIGSILLFLMCLGFWLDSQDKRHAKPGPTHPARVQSTSQPAAIFSSVVA